MPCVSACLFLRENRFQGMVLPSSYLTWLGKDAKLQQWFLFGNTTFEERSQYPGSKFEFKLCMPFTLLLSLLSLSQVH